MAVLKMKAHDPARYGTFVATLIHGTFACENTMRNIKT